MMVIKVWNNNEVMKYELIIGGMRLNEEVLKFNSRCSSMQSRAKLSEALLCKVEQNCQKLFKVSLDRASRQNATKNFL